jgi:hypothetical protein
MPGRTPIQVITVGKAPEALELGPFRVQFFPVSHSLPEASGLIDRHAGGRVVHTGDFKADMSPGVGEPHDPKLLAGSGAQAFKALICDSTNVLNLHPGRSEASLKGALTDLMRKRRQGHGGGHDFRLERGAAENAGAGRTRGGALGLPDGARDAAMTQVASNGPPDRFPRHCQPGRCR